MLVQKNLPMRVHLMVVRMDVKMVEVMELVMEVERALSLVPLKVQ